MRQFRTFPNVGRLRESPRKSDIKCDASNAGEYGLVASVEGAEMGVRLIKRAASAYSYPLILKQLLHAPMVQHRDQEIVYRDRKRMRYGDLNERIIKLAAILTRAGVQPGDTVGVLDWDSNRFLEAFFAIPMMGAILQTVNVRLSPEQIAYTIDHAGSSVLLVNDEFAELVASIRAQIPKVRMMIVMSDNESPQTAGLSFEGEYEDMLARTSASFDFLDFDENAQATTFYTTGTTGLPKGVYFSHRQIVLHSLAELALLAMAPRQGRFHRDTVYMPITPMFHVHAWGYPWTATVAGVKQVYPGRYAPDLLLKLIKTEGVTFTHCVPTILQMLLNAPSSADVDLSRLTMIIGGSALPKALAKQALERGMDVMAGYGMSETGPTMTVAHVKTSMLDASLDEQVEIRTKTGIAAPLVELMIVDGDMKPLPNDGKAAGEIVVRAPWLTQGYLNNPEASEELWAGGYLHTNDIATIDPQGYVQITDRIKDVIKTGGEWVSSIQIEDLIAQRKGVSEVAVIGVKDDKWGERPVALVVREPEGGAELSEEDIKAHLKLFADDGVISKYGIPQKIVFVDHLTRTSVGKINKRELRTKYADLD
jgi:fatty-acyl-CoA synthase